MKRVCVFCGSSNGSDTSYARAAERMGEALLSNNLGLVYGGASVGTMGTIADVVLAGGGEVIGVIPQGIAELEVEHRGLTQLEVVPDMHRRKARMMELSDGFVAMPGGLGTLEEIFEAITWLQLEFHTKPCSLLNTNGYYEGLIQFLSHAETQGFVKQAHVDNILLDSEPESLLQKLLGYQHYSVSKLPAT